MIQDSVNKEFVVLHTGFAFHHADWNFSNVCSPFTRLHYVKSGNARLIHGDKIYEMKPGYLYLTPAYVTHGYACDGILELYYIHLYEQPGERQRLFDRYRFPVEVKAQPYDMQIIRRLVTINPGREILQYDPRLQDKSSLTSKNISRFQQHPEASEMENSGILRQLLSRFLLEAQPLHQQIDNRIETVLQYIHNHSNETIAIDTLAESCHLSKDHFIRLFKNELHTTPARYIIRKKIESAQLRLLINQEPIATTAYQLGFENISYFNRLFKKETGISPGTYKNQMKNSGRRTKFNP
ncbi:MAG: hypothetical protein BGP01_07795 [Paludibacter sp. 47-17]|jgi:AraC-like DNA-binding protein|nr:MAG: hypothetical protein ABS72_01000 [Paludibacter sp. SCN 50-10]OJX92503.1 MAG: hypothetical protein BGP01_07795 [Paludibacter sp. 47-17]